MNVVGKFLLLALLTGCAKTSLSVRQMSVDRSYLASSFVGSPDPMQADPPRGQMLVVDWKVDDWILEERPRLVLEVVLKNYEKRRKKSGDFRFFGLLHLSSAIGGVRPDGRDFDVSRFAHLCEWRSVSELEEAALGRFARA